MSEIGDDGRGWSRQRWAGEAAMCEREADRIGEAFANGEYDRFWETKALELEWRMSALETSARTHCPPSVPDWRTSCPCRKFLRIQASLSKFSSDIQNGYQMSLTTSPANQNGFISDI